MKDDKRYGKGFEQRRVLYSSETKLGKIGIVEGVMKIEGITLDTLSEATGIYPTTLEMWLDYQILLDKLQLDNISTALNILA